MYSQFLTRLDGSALIWKDGTRTPLSGGYAFTSPADRLNRPDLHELLRQPYPASTPLHPPAFGEDPGRARSAAFFGKMYGAGAQAVRANLVPVNWFGQVVLFSRVNGANLALQAVARDLAGQPGVHNYLTPSAGTFLWRKVAGGARESAHSWCTAIDLNTRYSNDWQWESHREFARGVLYRNQLPQAVVWASEKRGFVWLEKRGFVWGGHWYHHDTMHFEFRPELSGC